MEGRLAIVLAGVVATCALALPVAAQAYDDDTTHPALTEDIAALHDRLYPEDPLSAEERSWMIQGSVEEDIVPRSLNHLYDPVHRTGWTGKETGWTPAVLVRVMSLLAILPDAPLASVQWIKADGIQVAYSRYGGNRSWQAGLRALASGDRERAYQVLGSALHLLADAGVPDHARDDTHVHRLDLVTGDTGSPYESFAKKYRRGSKAYPKGSVSKASVRRFGSPSGYLDDNARFASASFFSKDTIQDPGFPGPVITREDGGIAYGRTADGREVPLARRVARSLPLTGTVSSLLLADSAEFGGIFQKQFDVMAERTVLLGVGLVRDFRESKEAMADEPSAQASIWSLAGEVSRASNAVVTVASRASQAAGAQVGRAYDWLSGAFGRTNEPAPVAEAVPVPQAVPPKQVIVTKSVPAKAPSKAPMKSAVKPTAAPAKETKSPVADIAISQACPAAGPAPVVINEIAWMGSRVSATDEWIELKNEGASSVTLTGWRLSATDGSLDIDLSEVRVAGGGYSLLERTDDGTVPGISAAKIYVGGMANEPPARSALRLIAPGCGVVGEVSIEEGWPAGDADSRRTMERQGTAWQTSLDPDGTPGRQNSSGSAMVAKPTAQQQSTSTKKATTTTARKPAKKVSPTTEAEEFVPATGTIRISEIQSGGADAGDEWIELYNVEDRPVSLDGWSLQYFPASATGSSVAQKWDFSSAATISGRGYYLVGRKPNELGTDGYRGAVAADATHRSFSLSGLGAEVVLVRGTDKVASSSAQEVIDRVSYPRLQAGESYERAAQLGTACLNPLPGETGEAQGNGCAAPEWFVRSVSSPQNTLSDPEPLPDVPDEEEHPGLGVIERGDQQWIAIPRALLGTLRDEDTQDWSAWMIAGATSTPTGTISTEFMLDPVDETALELEFMSCAGQLISQQVMVAPLTPISCQLGGPLSGSLANRYREDETLLLKVAGTQVATGTVARVMRYGYEGGRAGHHVFNLEASTTVAYRLVSVEGIAPLAPTDVAAELDGSTARITWGAASDGDNWDADLQYETSFGGNDENRDWTPAGSVAMVEYPVLPGAYLFVVRAVDPQGNRSAEVAMQLDVAPEAAFDHLVHEQVVELGAYPLVIPRTLELRSIALWVTPEGGPYCCTGVEVTLRTHEGTAVARFSGSRRTVDGAGEMILDAVGDTTLDPGRYELDISLRSEASNGMRLHGGDGLPYLRLVVDR